MCDVDFERVGKREKMFVMNENWTYIIKRIIYIFCFYALCSLDQIAGSAEPYVLHGAKHYTGVFVAVIVLTAYKFRDFKKLPYLIWIVAYICVALLVYNPLMEVVENNIALVADLIGIGLYGIIVIRMIYMFAIDKKRPSVKTVPFCICTIMLVLMTIIRYDFDWTLPILVMSISFYLTDFEKRDMQNLFCGMLDGILLGFLVIQGQALMHRPYDKVRYEGYYAQPSLNALFYLCAYYAALGKCYFLKLEKKNIVLRLFYILFAGFIVSTMLFTGSRAAFITYMVVTLLFLVFQVLSSTKRKVVVLVINGLLILVSVMVCVLPTYWLIRYMPVRFNDPVYFLADEFGGLEQKVQKNEPNDSEKYIELGEAADMMFERYLWFVDADTLERIEDFIRNFPDKLSLSLKVEAAEYVNELESDEYIEPGTDRNHPLEWTGVEGEGGYDVRLDIYRYFFKKLKLIGDKAAVQGVWITENFLASHCHNVFLQIAYDFGIIVGLLFIVVVMLSYLFNAISFFKKKTKENHFRIFVTIAYITIFVCFGMFEIDWMYGQLPFVLFWLMQFGMVHK